jgi:hypothetical protein
MGASHADADRSVHEARDNIEGSQEQGGDTFPARLFKSLFNEIAMMEQQLDYVPKLY